MAEIDSKAPAADTTQAGSRGPVAAGGGDSNANTPHTHTARPAKPARPPSQQETGGVSKAQEAPDSQATQSTEATQDNSPDPREGEGGVSKAQPKRQEKEPAQPTQPTIAQPAQVAGGVSSSTATSGPGAAEIPRETDRDASRRWRREGIAEQVAVFRDTAREEYAKAHPGCKRREAHDYAWNAAIAAFPPVGVEAVDAPPLATKAQIAPFTPDSGGKAETGQVRGLGDIPGVWPELSANASLQAELSWCQANRLRVVEEQGTGATVVHLDRALGPAPSYAALGWLETSIRSYAKYVDVVARSLKDEADERETHRRERMKIDRIRELLDEMHRDSE